MSSQKYGIKFNLKGKKRGTKYKVLRVTLPIRGRNALRYPTSPSEKLMIGSDKSMILIMVDGFSAL